MEDTNIWIITVAALAFGLLIGYFMGRGSSKNSEQQQALEDSRQELESYKSQVADHFAETAEMVNQMTESYRSVHEKLAKGAQTLCDADVAKSIQSNMLPQIAAETKDITKADAEPVEDDVTSVEPPRDYAPKKPDETGTLSEEYGITTEKTESSDDAQDNENSVADSKEASSEAAVKA